MPKESAGILWYRRRGEGLEVLLVHPGGPYWAKKDDGAWSIPKGELDAGEEPLAAAQREFEEETGLRISEVRSSGDFLALGSIRQPGGKVVHAWAAAGDCDPETIRSNTFSIEWPPRSGMRQDFPEVDRAAWLGLDDARRKILRGQAELLDRLLEALEQPQNPASD